MKNKTFKISAFAFLLPLLTGCIGHMGLSRILLDANLKVVDNRYAREGIFFLLTPIYGITLSIDYFIFNTIEFWTGKNVLTDEGALADQAAGGLVKINQKLNQDISQSSADVSFAKITKVDENTLEMSIHYSDGKVKKLRGEKQGNSVNFFIDNEFITTASVDELQDYVQSKNDLVPLKS